MVDYTEYQLRYGTESVANSSSEVISPAEMVLVVNDAGLPVAIRIGNVSVPTSVRDLPDWNQYSDDDKTKVFSVEFGAQVNAVTSVFGRTGGVVATTGDYNADKISETASNKVMTAAERSKLAGLPASFSGETFQTTWNANTNTPTLAGTGMTPGQWWQVSTSGVQFTKTFTAGTHRALVDTAGVLQPVLIGTGAVTSVYTRTGAIVAASGDYTADQVTETGTRVFMTPAEKTHIDALPATAAPLSHVGAGGAEHPLATTSVAGFQSAADKINAGLFGWALSESTPTVPDGCHWYQPSTNRIRRYESATSRFLIVSTRETTSPTVSSDGVAGFDNGCMWTDTTGNVVWFCLDNATGAAIWQKVTTPSAVSLGGEAIVSTPTAAGVLQFKGLAVAPTTGAPAITSDATTITVNAPSRQTGAEMVTAIDSEFGSTDWHAGAAAVQIESIPIVWCTNSFQWTDMPAAATEFFGVEFRVVRDLSTAMQIQFSRTMDGTFGFAGSKLYLEYSINNQVSWTGITGTDLATDGTSVSLATSFVNIPAQAKTASTWLRIMGSGGNGVIDPRIRNLITTITFPVTTTSGVRSGSLISYVDMYAPPLAWTVPSPENEYATYDRIFVDLSCVTEIQLSAECITAATLASTRIYLQYTSDSGSTWVTIPGTEITLNVTGTRSSGWATLPAGARQAGIIIRSFGGNATTAGQTATVKTLIASFKRNTFTPLLQPFSTSVWSPVNIIQYNSPYNGVAVGNAQEWAGRLRFPVDASNVTSIAFIVQVLSAGKAGTVGYLQYSLDIGTTWITISGTSVPLDSTGRKVSTQAPMPDAARVASCMIRFAFDNPASPAGTTSVTVGLTFVDFLYSVAAVAPWGTGGGSVTPGPTLPPQTIIASNQAILSDKVFIEGATTNLVLPPSGSNINTCELYCNKASLCNLVPTAGEAIDGVGPGGFDLMPFKAIRLLRRLSGTVTWFEV